MPQLKNVFLYSRSFKMNWLRFWFIFKIKIFKSFGTGFRVNAINTVFESSTKQSIIITIGFYPPFTFFFNLAPRVSKRDSEMRFRLRLGQYITSPKRTISPFNLSSTAPVHLIGNVAPSTATASSWLWSGLNLTYKSRSLQKWWDAPVSKTQASSSPLTLLRLDWIK